MRLFSRLVSCSLLTALVVSCSPKLHPEDQVKVERRKTAELVSALDSMSQQRPQYFYSKIKCDYSDTNTNRSFKTSVRLVKDSAVNALITFATVPVINSLIRPDSVCITNRQDNCYIKRDMNFIKEQFGVSFDYRNIEELFLGLPIGFDTNQRYFQIHDPYNYILSSHKKRVIRKELKDKPERDKTDRERGRDHPEREDRPRRDNRNDNEENSEEEVILKYYLSQDLRSLRRISVDSPEDTTSIDIQYLTRDSIEMYLVPNEVLITIRTPRNHMVINLDYDRTEVNVLQEIHFVIPEEYGECKQEQEE